MNGQDKQQQQAFLQDKAKEYRLSDDVYLAFMARFDPDNESIDNNKLAIKMASEWRNKDIWEKYPKLLSELKKIYEILTEKNCPIPPGKRGRSPKGQEPSSIAYRWLWEVEFPSWKENPNNHLNQDQINWSEICHQSIEIWRNMTTKLFSKPENIPIPLGLVERNQRTKHSQDPDREMGSKSLQWEQETITPITNQDFFDQVLGASKSSKSDGKRLMIIGEAGGGKSTQLLKIAEWIKKQNKGFPICVSLAKVKDKCLIEYLCQDWLRDTTGKFTVPENWQEYLENLLHDGNAWLLLDAADEMGIPNPLSTLRDKLKLGTFDNVRVVLTCRLNNWDDEYYAFSNDFDTYKMIDFSYGDQGNDDQVAGFINKWFSDAEIGKNLRIKLDESGKERIKDLVRNPLRLSLLCAIWQKKQGYLPDTKFDLYEEFVDDFYDWKSSEFPTDSEQIISLNNALGELALAAINKGYKSILPEKFVENHLRKKHPKLFDLAIKLNWLNEVGVNAEDEHDYAFWHPTIMEYFAACAIQDWDYFLPKNHINQPVSDKKYRIFESQWKEVILLWLGRDSYSIPSEDKEAFINKLINFDPGCDKFYKYQSYFLAAAGIAEFKDCSLADEIVQQIVKLGCGSVSIEKQKWVKYLQPIKEAASKVLEETDRKRAINALVEILADTSVHHVHRILAAHNLGKIDPGNRKAINTLEKILADINTNSDSRWLPAYILGEIDPGNQRAINALLEILADINADSRTRSLTTDGLAKIAPGNQQAIDALVEILTDINADSRTRILAAYILGKIAPGNQKSLDALVEILADTSADLDTRRLAANNLGKIDPGNQQVISALVEILADTSADSDTRILAANSLAKIAPGNPKAINLLEKILADTSVDSGTRWLAAYSLPEIDPGNPKAIDTLEKFLPGTLANNKARWLIAISLAKTVPSNPKAINALVEILAGSSVDYNLRIPAAHVLAEIAPGNQQAISTLMEILADTSADYNTRWLAAFALATIAPGNPKAISALVEILADITADFDTRILAAKSLAKIDPGNQQAIIALVQILKTDDIIPDEITETLQKIITKKEHYSGVVTALKDCLSDETYENNFNRFKQCYTILWQCAQNLTYPDFYDEWHKTVTPHPEMTENIGVGITPITQTLNLAMLPEIIVGAISNHPTLSNQIKFLCLNTDKFSRETDLDKLSKDVLFALYRHNFPGQTSPKISDIQDLNREIYNLTQQHQGYKFALIIQGEIKENFIKLCQELSETLAIGWITDRRIDAPITTLSREGDVIKNIINWLAEI